MQINRAEIGHFTDAQRASVWHQIAATKAQILNVADEFKARDNCGPDKRNCGQDFNLTPGVVVCTNILSKKFGQGSGELTYKVPDTPASTKAGWKRCLSFFSRAAKPVRDETVYTSLRFTSNYYGITYELQRNDKGVTYTVTQRGYEQWRWHEDPCGNLSVASCNGQKLPLPSVAP